MPVRAGEVPPSCRSAEFIVFSDMEELSAGGLQRDRIG